MDLSQFMTALRARRKAFLLVLMATIFTAVAVAMVVPKKYVATATLMMDARDEQTMAPSRMSPRERAGYISTQVDLMMSGRVATQVARDLKLAQKPGMREAYESDTGGAIPIEDWIAGNLIEKLKVDTSASNVMTVSFSSSDARFATAVANGFAKAFLDTSLALRTGPTREAAEWFEDQLKGFRTQVTTAQSKLASFQRAKGITFADERTDVDSARLGELSSQLLAAKNATYDAQTRFRQAKELVENGASTEEIPEVLSNAFLNGLKVELQRAEARMEAESNVLGQNHPGFVRTISEVQGLRDKLAVEAKKVIAGLGTVVEQSRKREEELRAAVEAQTQRIHSLRDYRAELAVMSRDVDNAQRAYDAVLTRFVTNKIDSRAQQTNVAMLTPAVEPLRPAHPKVGLITGLAVLVGTLLAAGVVWVLETLDRRVRSRADLDSRLAVPSLGYLSRWQPAGGRLLPAPMRSTARALPHPW